MTEHEKSGLHIDSDWKAEAAREKERLAEQERASSRGPAPGLHGAAGFLDIVNLLAMQAAIGLGGYQGPGGEGIPPSIEAAKHHIDMLDALEKKTAGNLNDDEKRVLDQVLYELRMQYVRIAAAATGPGPRMPD